MQARRQISRPIRYSITILVVMLIGCFSLVLFNSQGVVTVALEIFIISAVGFSFIAVCSYQTVILWRAVDFPWILTSFAAIVVSLVNISANDQKQYISTAQNEISRAFSTLIYATRSIITNDCEAQPTERDMRQSSPEPYPGACDRMRHFLPQMIYVSGRISNTINTNELKGWGRNMIIASDIKVAGGWKDQVAAAQNFIKIVDRYDPGLQKIGLVPGDTVENFILSTRLRLWYFVMAFFVGLRLSKTTAEVLQARAASPARIIEPGLIAPGLGADALLR